MFWLRFCRLLASVTIEGLVNLVHLIAFPLRRARERERILAVMRNPIVGTAGVRNAAVRKSGALLVVAGLGLAVTALGAGCRTPIPGSRFSDQIESLEWSTHALLIEHGRWQEGLVHDIGVLLDPELGEIPETFELFGW